MKNMLGNLFLTAIGVVIGIAITFGFFRSQESTMVEQEKQPLYWVAPMNANFRRDSPGKSPMGMDLIPVFADNTLGKGVIKVSANVEHNLGVKTTRVRRGLMKSRITALADVQYNEELITSVYPRVEGWVEKLFVKSLGQSVEAGEALYEIYSPQLVHAQHEMLTALKQGNKMLIASARERLESLQVPESDIARLEQPGGAVRMPKRTITIYAPRSGVASYLGIREGNFVKPGTLILTIAGMESVWVTADVFENDMMNINIGDPVEFEFDALAGLTRHARVDFVYPVLDQKTRTLKIRSTVENRDGRLKTGMYAKAVIESESTNESVLVPKNAVIRTALQNRVVLKTGEGEYKSAAVELGRVNTMEAEILQGLEPGDEVVVQAQFLLDSESSVVSDFQRIGLTDMDRGMVHDK